jgi:hypothetical protein
VTRPVQILLIDDEVSLQRAMASGPMYLLTEPWVGYRFADDAD